MFPTHKALGTIGRSFRVAGPLHSGSSGQLVVGHAGIVAGTALGGGSPVLESRLGVVEREQRLAILVLELHPSCVVEEDLEVTLRKAKIVGNVIRSFPSSVHSP